MAELERGVNDLATLYPELAKEWHPTKNGEWKPEYATCGTRRKVWWFLPYDDPNTGKHFDFEWEASIVSRVNGSGCPYISNRGVWKGFNDLRSVAPELCEEWDYEKNIGIYPEDYTRGSNKEVWWRCKICGYEWVVPISRRSDGHGCPKCGVRHSSLVRKNKIKGGENNLKVLYPELCEEWDYEKNEGILPEECGFGSGRKVWWKCKSGHSFRARISDRVRGSGCPECRSLTLGDKLRKARVQKGVNDVVTLYPELLDEWDYEKNKGLDLSDYTCGSEQKVWWKCKKGHSWKSAICNRTSGHGCPMCSKYSQSSFPEQAIYYYVSKKYPDAISRYKDGRNELDVFIPSLKTGIEYDGSYFHFDEKRDNKKNSWCKDRGIRLIRIREIGCPVLGTCEVIIRSDFTDDGLSVVINELLSLLSIGLDANVSKDKLEIKKSYEKNYKELTLANRREDLVKEWDYDKNGELTPDNVHYNSSQKVWWKCKKGHSFIASITNRVQGRGCPICAGKQVLAGYNDLVTVDPELAKEWDYEKNVGLNPADVTVGSNKRVWWKCPNCGQSYNVPVSRRKKSGCPVCASKIIVKGVNDLFTQRPDLIEEWDYEKNEGILPEEVSKGNSLAVWWKCKVCGWSWKAPIKSRCSRHGCPKCARKYVGESGSATKRKMKLIVGENDLATIRPDLLKEWDYEKNDYWTPEKVTQYSKEQVWWKCSECGESFLEWVVNKCNGTGKCPKCGN